MGCESYDSHPLGRWLNEGTSRYLAYEVLFKSKNRDRTAIMEWRLDRAKATGQLSRPLQDFEGDGVQTSSKSVGYLAVTLLVRSTPKRALSLRTLCEEVAAGATLPEAFETAFGFGLDDFYDAFEKHRERLNRPGEKLIPIPAGTGEAGRLASMPPNFKVAFIGDQGLSSASRAVLRMIRDEGADMVLHQGDFDYRDDPDAWDQQINQVLGEDFPYFASVGNHDVPAWRDYQKKLEARLAQINGARCTGDLGVDSFCTYKGLFFVLSGVGTRGSGHVSFTKEALASREAQESLWRVCSWHKNQRLMQVGSQGNSVGWEPYEECRKGGAIIATGHEHSYSPTHLMDSFETQAIASTESTLHVARGKSFAFVSGLGGLSIRGQDDQLAAKPWWAAVHTSARGAEYGALFCTFNHDGVENRGHCYFKDLNGIIADEFEVTVAAASDTAGPSSPGVGLHAGASNISYDIARDGPVDQIEVITSGLLMAQDFLDSELGGGIPADVQREVTVKIVATGRGNEERSSDGACCVGYGETDGVSIMRPFFDVAHPHWVGKSDIRHWTIVVHEYTHGWYHHLGCQTKFWSPLGSWLTEGTATYVAYETMIKRGHMQRAYVMDRLFSFSLSSGALGRPLRDFAKGAIRDIGIHPGNVGALALHRLVQSAPGGILSLRTLCEEVGDGASVPDAFETAFGVSLDDFYADFEKYREELNAG